VRQQAGVAKKTGVPRNSYVDTHSGDGGGLTGGGRQRTRRREGGAVQRASNKRPVFLLGGKGAKAGAGPQGGGEREGIVHFQRGKRGGSDKLKETRSCEDRAGNLKKKDKKGGLRAAGLAIRGWRN